MSSTKKAFENRSGLHYQCYRKVILLFLYLNREQTMAYGYPSMRYKTRVFGNMKILE